MINPTVEIPRDLIEALYRRCYNPVIAYRDPHGSALWEQVGSEFPRRVKVPGTKSR